MTTTIIGCLNFAATVPLGVNELELAERKQIKFPTQLLQALLSFSIGPIYDALRTSQTDTFLMWKIYISFACVHSGQVDLVFTPFACFFSKFMQMHWFYAADNKIAWLFLFFICVYCVINKQEHVSENVRGSDTLTKTFHRLFIGMPYAVFY